MTNLLRCYRLRAWSCTSQYTPGAIILSALHINHSDAPSRVRQNLHFDTPPADFYPTAIIVCEKLPRPLAIELPAAGNRSASRGQSKCQPRALEVPAAGTRIASRGHSKCQPRVLEVPAAGTRSASRRESNSQPQGIKFPALGNRVPSPWESSSQPLGIVFPAAGNNVPSPWESCSQAGWEFVVVWDGQQYSKTSHHMPLLRISRQQRYDGKFCCMKSCLPVKADRGR